jgi:hypothetical protein
MPSRMPHCPERITPKRITRMRCAALLVVSGIIVLHAADVIPGRLGAINDFQNRVDAYAKLHKSAQSELPASKQTNSAADILKGQHLLAAKIREKRQGAFQGNIFSPEISQEFHRLAGTATHGPAAGRVQKSLQRAEPVRLALRVNETYPQHVPLQSVPPTLLQNLPALPPELEYRVVGHALVLRDIGANLIVDFIPDLIP